MVIGLLPLQFYFDPVCGVGLFPISRAPRASAVGTVLEFGGRDGPSMRLKQPQFGWGYFALEGYPKFRFLHVVGAAYKFW